MCILLTNQLLGGAVPEKLGGGLLGIGQQRDNGSRDAHRLWRRLSVEAYQGGSRRCVIGHLRSAGVLYYLSVQSQGGLKMMPQTVVNQRLRSRHCTPPFNLRSCIAAYLFPAQAHPAACDDCFSFQKEEPQKETLPVLANTIQLSPSPPRSFAPSSAATCPPSSVPRVSLKPLLML